MKRRNQNQKFSFPFFVGSPHTPRRKSKKGRKIFGFGLRAIASVRGALVLWILLEIVSNFVQYTPQILKCLDASLGILIFVRIRTGRGSEKREFLRVGIPKNREVFRKFNLLNFVRFPSASALMPKRPFVGSFLIAIDYPLAK